MDGEMKKVGIIGAGLGGLTAGVLLSERGYSVEIFEKERIIGGRALTLDGDILNLDEYQKILHRFDMWMPFTEPSLEEIFERSLLRGYRFDLGFHLLGSIDRSPVLTLLNRYHKRPRVLASRFGVIGRDGKITHHLPFSLSLMDKFRWFYFLSRITLIRESTLSSFDAIPLSQILEKYCRCQMIDSIGIYGRLIATVNDIGQISSGETIRVMRRFGLGVRPTGYPANGTSMLSRGLSDAVFANGGNIFLNSRVDRILIEDGIARGLSVDGERKTYDFVISSLPVQDLFQVADEKLFPPQYVKDLKNLSGTGSVSACYALREIDSKRLRRPYAFTTEDSGFEGGVVAGIIDFQTADPGMGLSPEGRYLVQGYAICTPQEARDKRKVGQLRALLDENLERLMPGFKRHLDFALYPTSYHLDGVAKTIGNRKPGSKAPIKNLFLVGDGVQATGIGMNGAVDSAFRLVKKINHQG